MKLGVLKETRQGERRVAISPKVAAQLIAQGYSCAIETGAGNESSFSDAMYAEAGCKPVGRSEILSDSDVVIAINPIDVATADLMKVGQVLVSLLYHRINTGLMEKLASKGVSALSMDAIPRISRAQSMDVLSSQSNLAGYKAVILGANELTRIFPLMMTAAGTITPSRVLIYGVGVAGLQAIATAKRLGAVVEATDVRPETKEQCESLGGKFITVEGDVGSEGGYAKETTDEYRERQKEAVNKSLFKADLVITTALVPGKKAPLLITEEQVKQMKLGAVIVDMAVEQGGNCELSKLDEVVHVHGVHIVGKGNLPSTMATNASELYAKNVENFLKHMATPEAFKWEMEEEITNATLITHQGQIRITE